VGGGGGGGGGEGLKGQNFLGKYEPTLKFPGGWVGIF